MPWWLRREHGTLGPGESEGSVGGMINKSADDMKVGGIVIGQEGCLTEITCCLTEITVGQ